MTALDDRIDAILTAVQSGVSSLGEFESVMFHEPKSAPGANTAALWLDRIMPIPTSGLDQTSALVLLQCRIYNLFNGEPQDAIDPAVAKAAAAVIGLFDNAFTIGGLVRNVDVFGANGFALSAAAGYVNQDATLFRVMTVQIPLIINDLWSEVA